MFRVRVVTCIVDKYLYRRKSSADTNELDVRSSIPGFSARGESAAKSQVGVSGHMSQTSLIPRAPSFCL